MSDEMPTDVFAALRAVSDEVQSIGERKSEGLKYSFRSIKDALAALHGPLIKYGVVIVPQVRKAKNIRHKVMRDDKLSRYDYECQLTVDYLVQGPGGPSDNVTATVFAVGIDNSDKGSGKAMSYAWKTLIFQLFCIPVDDTSVDNEVDDPGRSRQPAPQPVAKDAEWEAIAADLRALPDADRKEAVDTLINQGLFTAGRKPNLPFTAEQKQTVRDMVDGYKLIPARIALTAGPSPARAQAQAEGRQGELAEPEVPSDLGPMPDQASVLLAAEPAHADHAVTTMLIALDETELPDDITTAQWYLADYANPDEIDWKKAAKAFNFSQPRLLTMAKGIAQADPETFGAVPERLDEIRGDLAVQLRLDLIASVSGDPFP